MTHEKYPPGSYSGDHPQPTRTGRSRCPITSSLTDTSLDSTLEADFNLNLPELEALLGEDTPETYGAYLFRQVFEESVDEDGKKGRIGARLHGTAAAGGKRGMRRTGAEAGDCP